ncbi:LamG-like jellyroll fold domain-containing protein [Breznakia sp. PF5-3]|uniref:LamG-like jellyroll fold domain-containing protein n=6 Tax=unclassified Breznakia TaxID=2623764 RepID=UPI0024066454|nr:LamG-like jellyroll fold domain-containing protein [Breznakia sp. PF5-3]
MKIFLALSFALLSFHLNEIPKLYANDDLDQHLVLDVAFEDSVEDSSAYKTTGTIVGDVTFEKGVKGKAIRITNGDKGSKDRTKAVQYVDFGKADNLKFTDQDYTMSFWMNAKACPGDGAAVLSNKDFYSGSNKGFTAAIFSNGLRFNFTPEGASRQDISPVANESVLNEGWHHFVISVKRKDKITVYRDGVQTNTKDISTLTTTIDTDYNFVLGASGVFENGVVDGLFDELKVYKTNLSLDNAKTLYVDGLVSQTLSSSKRTYNLYKGLPSVDQSLITTLKAKIDELETMVSKVDDITYYDQILGLINDVNTAENTVKDELPTEPEEGLVLYLDFEDDVKDKSGYENDGTIVNTGGGSLTYKPGAVGKGLHIQSPNGSKESNAGGDASEYVKLPEADSLKFNDQSFSIALWTKFPSAPSGVGDALISNKNWYSGANRGFTLGAFSNGVTTNATAATGGRYDTGRYSIYDNNWHFVVTVVDRENKTIKFYVDNELKETKSIPNMSGSIDVDNLSWVIGATGTYSNGISNAYVDEVRFYSQVLSEARQDSLYTQFDKSNVLLTELEAAEAHVNKVFSDGGTTQKRFDEAQEGFTYIRSKLAGADDKTVTRLTRDLKNILARFEQETDPLMTFNVVTDTHIDRKRGEVDNLDNYLQDLRWLNPDSKVVMNSGDFTDGGSLSEYQTHFNILSKNAIEGRYYMNTLGNHDVRWLCSTNNPESGSDRTVATCPVGDPNADLWRTRYLQFNTPYMGDEWNGQSPYHKKWVDGYLFISLSTEKDLKDWAYLSEEQLQWLDDSLSESDPNKPAFISLHQILDGTANYEEGDLVGAQDEQLKAVLRKHPHAVLFTGHIHSTVDRADLYHGDWGFMMDMASYSYAYTAGADKRNQVSYQVEVYDDEVVIRVRDHVSGEWLDQYEKSFWITDPVPADPSDDSYDIDVSKITPTAGTEQSGDPVTNLFDNDDSTIWHSKWSGEGTTREQTWVNMHLDEATNVAGFRYKPRSNGGNGSIAGFEVYISNDGGLSYTKHAEGTFPVGNASWKVFEFDSVLATDVKIQITSNNGSGIYGSGAEMRLLRPKNVDLGELQALIEQAEAIIDNDKEDTMTSSSWNTFMNAYETAVNLDENASAIEVKVAKLALEEAIKNLEPRASETAVDALETLIDTCKAMEDDFLEADFAGMKTLIEASETLLAKGREDLSSSEVSKAIEDLLDAKKALEANKAETNSLLDTLEIHVEIAQDILDGDTSSYRPGKVKELEKAVDEGKALVEANSKDKAAIIAATDKIADAMSQLWDIVDKSELTSLIIIAEKYAEADYSAESWVKLETALAAAKTIVANDDATEAQVAKAYKDLFDAINGLERKINTEALEREIAAVEKILANKAKYVASSIKGLPTALESAKNVLANGKTQAEIDAATKALTKEKLKARLKADTSALSKMVTKANNLEVKGYTAGSVDTLNAAIKEAQAVLNNEEVTQEEVKAAELKLEKAMNGLKKVSSPSKAATSAKGVASGDTTDVNTLLSLMVLSGAILIANRKRLIASKK